MTAVLAKVAIKATSGLDLPVSEFLNGTKSYLGEELADRMLDDDVVERALSGKWGRRGRGGKIIDKAYEELKIFIEEHESKSSERYVHFDRVMELADDRDGEKIWVSKKNAQQWKAVNKPPKRRWRWKDW